MLIENLRVEGNKILFDVDKKQLFLSVDQEYIQYSSLTYDGPMILCLPVAMKKQEDIIIKGKISYKLYDNVTKCLMKIISIMIPVCKKINIIADEYSYGENYENQAVGCGLSCGVDSLCCLGDYYFNHEGPYKITHVTNFKAGASDGNNIIYNKRTKNIKEYINNTDLKFMKVDTNFLSINKFGHRKIHTLRNLAVVLFFQKLFKRYYYSSSFSYKDIKIIDNSPGFEYSDAITVHLFSTENIEIISQGSQYTRPEKTYLITENKLSHKYLDVCVNPSFVQNTKGVLNCSKCSKCFRTLRTLEYYESLDLYKNVFMLDTYHKVKNNYIKKLNKNDAFDREIIELYK